MIYQLVFQMKVITVRHLFICQRSDLAQHEKEVIAEVLLEEGLEIIGWRVVPVRSEILGKASAECEPAMEQLFVKRPRSN